MRILDSHPGRDGTALEQQLKDAVSGQGHTQDEREIFIPGNFSRFPVVPLPHKLLLRVIEQRQVKRLFPSRDSLGHSMANL